MAQFYFDEYGQKRFVNETYGSVPPPGTPVYSDDASQGLAPSPSPSTLPMSLSYEAPPALNGELFSGLPIQRMSPSLGNNPFSMEIPPSLPDSEQGGAASEAPAQRLGTGVDPNAPAVSPSLYGSNMFRTAEQEFEFNQAVARGDTKRAQELIREADVYAKERARSEKIDNMVNLAVMTGLGIAAGAPGSYGDFGTQVARGALTGINYGLALRQQDANEDYRQGQLENARARALSYQQQVENSRRNTNLRATRGVIRTMTDRDTGKATVYNVDPYNNRAPIPIIDPDTGMPFSPAPGDVVVATNQGVLVYDKNMQLVKELRDPATGERAMSPDRGNIVYGSVGEEDPGPIVVGRSGQGTLVTVGGEPVRGSNTGTFPLPPNTVQDSLDELAQALPYAPPSVVAMLNQIRREYQQNPGAFNPQTLNARLKDIRDQYENWLKSPEGRLAQIGALGGGSPNPAPTPTPAAPTGPPLPAPAAIAGGISPAPGGPPPISTPGPMPSPTPAATLAPAPTPAPTPTPQRPSGPPPRATPVAGVAPQQQAIVDTILGPLQQGASPVSGRRAVQLVVETTGMDPATAEQAVRNFVARSRPGAGE